MTSLTIFFDNVKLPTISEVGHALIATLDNDDASSKDVAAIIARDPALTAKLMRLANSARFGSSRNVSSLDDAISLAGMAHIRTLALAACFADSFPALPGLDSDEFWKSSMACAGYAKWLAGGLGIDGGEAWLAGMMLRLGELLIYQVSPVAFAQIEQLPHLPGGRWEREQKLLGFSEGQITAELGRRWNFPLKIVRALECSSDPMAAHPFCQLAGIIHLASLLADTPSDDPAILDTLPADVMSALQVRKEWLGKRFPSHDSFSAAP
ncbi:HDOD domain-containing protein [Pseudoduganella buxea]|uniref:HDOD domain-containing protein n=1 Tax=Pseudoduganella buxea TaxID=1949069 RepID=A0A6I3SS71_9BURK|nr:HDOD domain-containing protein [Pseudoduganella buxea]MTV51556.1 HDOD domain-containing protein [Pseudoduganella buxea]GGB89974.1 histidine kinase [Pseudoduganella buxea]